MFVWEILSQPAVGNLLILFAAIIGVGGSWKIYQRRLSNRADSVRRSLISEIESNDIWNEVDDEAIIHDVYSTTVYESAGSDIGLLTDEEVSAVSEVYALTTKLGQAQTLHGQLIIEAEQADGEDLKYRTRNEKLLRKINELESKSKIAKTTLKNNLGSGYNR